MAVKFTVYAYSILFPYLLFINHSGSVVLIGSRVVMEINGS